MEKSKEYFVPAEHGWLALFEHEVAGEVVVTAEPVLAWRFAVDSASGYASMGHAVVGARPWVEKADSEATARFFEVVHEKQLDPAFLAELRGRRQHSREDIMEAARRNRESRLKGHQSWVRDRRHQKEDDRRSKFRLF